MNKELKELRDFNDLHIQAIELMEKLNNKYGLLYYTSERRREKPIETLSLDEYLYEYYDLLNNKEINEIKELIDKFK